MWADSTWAIGGKIENGVVSVGSLWADESVYYPLAVEPEHPLECWFAAGKADPAFRTKPQIALDLVAQAVAQQWPFGAVVADCLYGQHHGYCNGFVQRAVPYVVALKPSHAWLGAGGRGGGGLGGGRTGRLGRRGGARGLDRGGAHVSRWA